MKLKHKTKDIFSEVIFLPFVHKAYILTVDKNIAGSCIIKASDNVKQGRFAAAAFSDYNALFAAFNIKGKILYDGSLANIKYRFGNTKTIYIQSNLKLDIDEINNKYKNVEITNQDEKIAIKFSLNDVDLDDMLLYLINTYHVKDFKIEDISIEDITKQLYEKN